MGYIESVLMGFGAFVIYALLMVIYKVGGISEILKFFLMLAGLAVELVLLKCLFLFIVAKIADFCCSVSDKWKRTHN